MMPNSLACVYVKIGAVPVVEPLTDAELAKLVEKLRTLHADNKSERNPDTLAMAEVESVYALKKSSNRLEKLTSILIILTVILAIFTAILLLK